MGKALLLQGVAAAVVWTGAIYVWWDAERMAVPPNASDEGARQAELLLVLMTSVGTWFLGLLVIVAVFSLAYAMLRRRSRGDPSN